MSDPWPDMMTKFTISPVKSSTDNRLLRGVIREGCLAAWEVSVTKFTLGNSVQYQDSIPGTLLQPVIFCNWQKTGRLESPMNLDSYWSNFFFFFFVTTWGEGCVTSTLLADL